jgi:HPt (histidine-containing phosphotransfer) domain-containing protein
MTRAQVLDPAVIDTLRQLNMPGEPDVLSEVLRLFLDEVPPRIARLCNAWETGNIQELQRTAHSLKGSAGNVGAHGMAEVCKQLEGAGKSGSIDSAGQLIAALDVEFDKVKAEIRRLTGVEGELEA